MGFSTVAAELLFFIAVIAISVGVIAVFGTYIDQVKGAMSDKNQYVVGQLRTDIVITNIDNSTNSLRIYVKNVGTEQLATDCIELYVDGGWVSLTANRIVDPTTGAEVSTWVPKATIKLNPAAAPLNGGSVHEAKLVTCNGIWDSKNF